MNKHSFMEDNRGIFAEYLSFDISYHKCVYCPKFIVKHPAPVPSSFIRSVLKQKSIFENQMEKEVLVEKFDFHPRVTALRRLKKVLNQQ